MIIRIRDKTRGILNPEGTIFVWSEIYNGSRDVFAGKLIASGTSDNSVLHLKSNTAVNNASVVFSYE
ncbi:MAG: hypothetical protein PHI68_03845 [Candidatus Cloacimonetes bacterium]|nr:hypothetical protein [Candidatus Cloacimonadota bacterium]